MSLRPHNVAARLLLALALLVAVLVLPASASAEEATVPAATQTTTVAPASPETTAAPATPAASTEAAAPASGATPEAVPEVQSEISQGVSAGVPAKSGKGKGKAKVGQPSTNAPSTGSEAEGGQGEGTGTVKGRKAPKPSALTPALPLALSSPLSGVPSFFIESFQIPPFLLPIFQAAGTAYGVPWQVLAAINEVETDYGRDLSLSSAGAEGWMQFLPTEWAQYGVDANGAGFKDPYNPADAIFAAARYLRAAGGDTNIRAAVLSYNHSQSYVESVMLRAQLLGGTPSELLGAITGLTEARFPVHASAHYSDGFPLAGSGAASSRTLTGTTIFAAAGAPVIAVQDGEVVQIGHSKALGRFLVLRDAYGNRYTYARLGHIAAVYPVLTPRVDSAVSPRITRGSATQEPAPSGPATAGAQARSPLTEGATVSGFALGAAAGLESTPTSTPPAPAAAPAPPAAHSGEFAAGQNDVYLHPLRPGVQVIAGTVLGHIGPAAGPSAAEAAPHMLFQIRPAGIGAPLIDPKPILDGWVALENSSIFRAKGENPFLTTSPSTGEVLLESKQQLEPQVLHDAGIHLGRCGRQDVESGRVDKRVLAMLEYLSVSGLRPTVSGLGCTRAGEAAQAAYAPASASSEAVDIVAINGIPIAGHQGEGSIADTTVRKLLMLQGAARPRRLLSLESYPGAHGAVASPSASRDIRVIFSAPGGLAQAAGLSDSTLSPSEWIKLVARLGEIPDPTVAARPSSAAIPDSPATAGEAAGGNH